MRYLAFLIILFTKHTIMSYPVAESEISDHFFFLPLSFPVPQAMGLQRHIPYSRLIPQQFYILLHESEEDCDTQDTNESGTVYTEQNSLSDSEEEYDTQDTNESGAGSTEPNNSMIEGHAVIDVDEIIIQEVDIPNNQQLDQVKVENEHTYIGLGSQELDQGSYIERDETSNEQMEQSTMEHENDTTSDIIEIIPF